MNHNNHNSETGSITETQRAEQAANVFFDMADNDKYAKDQKTHDALSIAGQEANQGNYDKAQCVLESNVKWDDRLREAASSINQIDNERRGIKPMTIEDVQKTISGYARNLEKISKERGGAYSDLEKAMALDNLSGDIAEDGIQGIENALTYIEQTLKSKSDTIDSVLASTTSTREEKAETIRDLHEKRAMRDALLREKQKRTEQQQQSAQETERTQKDRSDTSRHLKNLYAQTGTPKESSLQNEFLKKISTMSPEELRFLDSALAKTAAEFSRTRDSELLNSRLEEFASQSFKPEDIAKQQQRDDKTKLDKLREAMKLSKEPREKTETAFEKLYSSLEKSNPLSTQKESPYTAEKGAAAILEIYKERYGNPEQFSAKMEQFLAQFHSALELSRQDKPDVSEEGHRNKATKEVMANLSPLERQAIEDFLNHNHRTLTGGRGQRFIATEAPFGDFLGFIEKLKASSKTQ